MNGLSPLAQRMLAIAMSEQDRQSFDPSVYATDDLPFLRTPATPLAPGMEDDQPALRGAPVLPIGPSMRDQHPFLRRALPGGDSLSPLLRAQGGIADLEQQMGSKPITIDSDPGETEGKLIDLDAEGPAVDIPRATEEDHPVPHLPGVEPTIPRPPEGFVQPGPPQAGGKTPTPATTTGGPRAGKMRTRIMDGDKVVYDSLLDPLRNFSGGASTDLGVGAALRGLTVQARTPEERSLAETSRQIAQEAWLNGLDAPSAMKLGLDHWQKGIGALEDSKRTDMMRPKGGGGAPGGIGLKRTGMANDDLGGWYSRMMTQHAVPHLNKVTNLLNQAVNNIDVGGGVRDHAALSALLNSISGATVSDAERAGWEASGGLSSNLTTKISRFLAMGPEAAGKDPAFMQELQALLMDNLKTLRAARERASSGIQVLAYEYLIEMGYPPAMAKRKAAMLEGAMQGDMSRFRAQYPEGSAAPARGAAPAGGGLPDEDKLGF